MDLGRNSFTGHKPIQQPDLMGKKSQKLRAEFRKNRSRRARGKSWTRDLRTMDSRIATCRRKKRQWEGGLTRRRTVVGQEVDARRRAASRGAARSRRVGLPRGEGLERARADMLGQG